jgi:hypothetical protein
LAYRELDEALGLTVLGEDLLSDWPTGKNTPLSTVALTRQSLFSRLAGYEDTHDAERLSPDPTMRHVVGGHATEHTAASAGQMGRFETEVLTQPGNLNIDKRMLLGGIAMGIMMVYFLVGLVPNVQRLQQTWERRLKSGGGAIIPIFTLAIACRVVRYSR